MNKITPIILNSSLNVGRGGLTKAVFTRANTLVKHFEEVYIYTFLYQRNHKDIIDKIYKMGLLDRRVKVLNLFEDTKPNKEHQYNIKNVNPLVKESGLIEFRDSNSKNPSYRYYSNGLYVMYKRFDKNGNLLFIDEMDEGRHRIKRHEFNNEGLLVRIRHMDIVLNKPRLDRYFDNTGNCYLTVWVDPKTSNEGGVQFFGNDPIDYKTIKEFQEAWVEEKIEEFKNPILMSDRRDIDKVSININHENLKRIAVIHSNHYKKPYDSTAEVRDNNRDDYKFLFENLDKFNSVVILTNEQKKDVENLYGEHDVFRVIPHSAKQVNKGDKQIESYDPNLVITLARYHKQKGLDQAIKTFKIVVDQIPTAKYYIYGNGEEESNLNQLIRELNLENNVKLKKFTTNASKVYKKAACSILTSEFEGFGLVITESMSLGTPVISYDTKYGPTDIIRDNIDGFIVDKGNKEKLAERIISIMMNKNLRNRLSKNAIEVDERFSVEDYMEKWINLLLKV